MSSGTAVAYVDGSCEPVNPGGIASKIIASLKPKEKPLDSFI